MSPGKDIDSEEHEQFESSQRAEVRTVDPKAEIMKHEATEDDISPEEESEIRRRIREKLLQEEETQRRERQEKKADRSLRTQVEGLRWQTIQNETEKFHRERGRKKYITAEGRTRWLTPDEFAIRRAMKSKARKRRRTSSGRWHPERWAKRQVIVMGESFVLSVAAIMIMFVIIYLVEFV